MLSVFNQKTLYDAYKKRTKDIEVDMEAYNKAKEADPEFYRDASSLQYGKVLLPSHRINKSLNGLLETRRQLTDVCFALHRCPMSLKKTLTRWSRNSRSGKRSGNRSAGGASLTKTRTLIRSTTGMSTSTRRLSARSASTRSRSRTTSKEVLPCRTKTVHSSSVSRTAWEER
jgi:hypothetical protein